MSAAWDQTKALPPQSYTCGYCGHLVSSAAGYAGGGVARRIYICPHCGNPSYFGGRGQVPGVAPGKDVPATPTDVEALYKEARACVAAGAYTAAVLTCRKLLMNLSVSQGAKPGESFVRYVEFLANKGFVPPNGRGWVDHIRKKGNEATHEIHLMARADAEELVTFSEMLLRFVYEFPSRVPSDPSAPSAGQT